MKLNALEAIGKHSKRRNEQENGYPAGTREFQRWSQNMASLRDWKDLAVRQGARADQAQRKVEAQEHALNLLLNGQMVQFHTARTPDGTFHDFSLGIARNVPIDDPKRKILARQSSEDFPVVLWRTRFEPKGAYATVYEPRQFSRLADQATDQPALKQVLRNAALLLKQQFPDLNAKAQFVIAHDVEEWSLVHGHLSE
jgi:hypothetical protein